MRPGPGRLQGALKRVIARNATFPSPVASQLQMPRDAADEPEKEIVMFTVVRFGHPAQRTLCMVLSMLIVSVSLGLADFATERAADSSYSVTVTQLQ